MKEPVVTPVAKYFKRVVVKLPSEPANRPVPPVMMLFSTIVRRPGAVRMDFPLRVPNTLSPLAAVNTKVPVPIPVARFTVAKMVRLNLPRWVAFPFSVTFTDTITRRDVRALDHGAPMRT